METPLHVISVAAQEDYTLLLVFENGQQRRFDMKPPLEKKPFCKLRDLPPVHEGSSRLRHSHLTGEY
ncbi:MAG TPA: DUF2442 domain-containing protein [Sedimentisphaerales bacterium]|nr:DUF2442 domain-containing protein [Sedimentisphaerales bacterium]